MIRNILMASALLMGVSGAAMAAEGWNPPLPAQSHSEPVSEGSPHLTGLNQGNADIQYSGEAKGNLSKGMPFVIGSEGGSPVIVYR